MYSRRDVIKTAVAMPALLGAQSPNDTIRVAVIGVGNRGSYDLKNGLKVPRGKVVALCDLDEDRLPKAAAVVGASGRTPPPHTPIPPAPEKVQHIYPATLPTPHDT